MKRGFGSQRKNKVLIKEECNFVDNPKKGCKPKRIDHIKMDVISDLESFTVIDDVKDQVGKSSEILTDDSTSNPDFK